MHVCLVGKQNLEQCPWSYWTWFIFINTNQVISDPVIETVMQWRNNFSFKEKKFVFVVDYNWFWFLPYFINNFLAGTYSLANASYCTVCPAEVACPDTDQATTVLCFSGLYSVGGQDSCTKCEAGQACPNKDGSGNFFCLPVSL